MPITLSVPIQVAIADDHVRYRGGIKAMLSGKPDVQLTAEAGNGQELLELLSTTPINVVLLDIRMPIMDGVATLPIIREKFPDIKVIMLSMHNEHHMINELMLQGAHTYLSKTSDAEIIYQTIVSFFE